LEQSDRVKVGDLVYLPFKLNCIHGKHVPGDVFVVSKIEDRVLTYTSEVLYSITYVRTKCCEIPWIANSLLNSSRNLDLIKIS
jgi:hypothetical protein